METTRPKKIENKKNKGKTSVGKQVKFSVQIIKTLPSHFQCNAKQLKAVSKLK